MAVRRIVTNVATSEIGRADMFYGEILGLKKVMDHGWIATFQADESGPQQISFASQGGSDQPVPEISIEVDNLDEVQRRLVAEGFAIVYGPVHEPWGVRRFFVRDPFGRTVNILTHD